MSPTKVRLRSEIPVEYTWNAESVFPTPQAWDEEIKQLKEDLPQIEKFRGHLGDSPETLVKAMETVSSLYQRAGKVLVYASLAHEVDTADQTAARRMGQVMGLFGQLQATISFIDPELLTVGQEKLNTWMQENPQLKVYEHYVENLFRLQAHVRSQEIEEVMGMLATPFSGTQQTASLMSDADFRFEPAVSSDGAQVPVTQGTYEEILAGSDREARRTAFESYTSTYLSFKNTLANNLATYFQQNVFNSRVRKYDSTLEASLYQNNIPVDVYHNMVETFKKNLPTWHRYWAIRRKALGVDTLHPYDIWAPLTAKREPVTFPQAIEWISAGLAPMGDEYVQVLRQGALKERWIDVYPNQGKSSAQFSSGFKGTSPFIFINYDDTIFSMSTLAHELGHSMHSYLTWQTQPFIYSDYSLFVAEVASNFHQAMVRAYLLDHSSDPEFQISVIEEAMSNFHRYFFIMPTLARFELEAYSRAERGQGLPAEDLNELMADLFAEGYGSEMGFDRSQVGITWATFGHLYANYYVFQYTTGISAANALSRRILSGQPNTVEHYLNFLKAGGSVYPLDALKMAGVDMTTPQPIEETFSVMSGLIDRLETLVNARGK